MAKGKRVGKILNEDIPLLRQVLSTMQDVRAAEERREWHKGRMLNITQHLSWTRGGGGKQGLDEAFEGLSEIEEEHAELVKKYLSELKRAETIINGIENRQMRTFVCMLYLEHIPGNQVREELNMTRYAFDRARERIEQAKNMKSAVWDERFMTGEKL